LNETQRYEWFDQLRGLIALGYLISAITGALAGNMMTGSPFLGPTFLSHGYGYYSGRPAFIGVIDLGQADFMFVMGFAAYGAVARRLGSGSLWRYVLRRVALLYALAYTEALLEWFGSGKAINWSSVLYDGTLPKLAIGGCAAYVTVYWIRSADVRVALSASLLALHAILYAFPLFDHNGWQDDVLNLPHFPFGTMNLTAIAIAGAGFSQWIGRDPARMVNGFKRRVIPVSTAAVVLWYLLEWLQPSEHHDSTTALSLLAIGFTGYTMAAFYSLEQMGLRAPLLSALGRNLLLMFVSSLFFIDFYFQLFSKSFLAASPLFTMVFAGLLPLAALSALALYLDKKGVLIKA
jgi:hypothetical protein